MTLKAPEEDLEEGDTPREWRIDSYDVSHPKDPQGIQGMIQEKISKLLKQKIVVLNLARL